jgi:iron complex outermembrane receptor protein
MQSFDRNRARLMGGVAMGLALGLASVGAAQAQDAGQTTAAKPDEVGTVGEVVVTGIRRGIESSIATKKTETSIVEVVSAEDIGKLPDVSIAESIGRLPGLALQRLDGRGQVLSIRGLAPDFSTALLNGREQVTTGNNRGVEFDQYPSELLSSVVVYKTPDSALIGQGLAGTADMRTVRPLAHGKRTFAVGARYEWDDIGALAAGSKSTGNRYSLSYIDQFADGRVGVALGYAHMESPYQAERWNAWGYPNVDIEHDDRYGQGLPGSRTPRPGYAEEAGKLVLGGAKPYVMSSLLKRDSVMGTLEFKPTDNFSSTLDVFYSKFDNVENLKGIEFPLYWSGATLQPATTISDGMITKGQFNGVGAVVRNDMNTRSSTLKSVGWNTKVGLSDDWTATADISWSQVKRTDMVLESYAGTGRAGVGATDNLGFTMTGDGTAMFSSTIDYADPGQIFLTMPQGWGSNAALPGGQDGYLNMPSIEDELRAVRLSAERRLDGPFRSVELGANFSQRSKGLQNDEWFLKLPSNPASVPIPANAIQGVTSLAFIGIPGMISYDPMTLIHDGVYERVANPNADVAVKSWQVDEEVALAYVKANIDTQLGPVPVTGNIGLQVVRTNQGSDAVGASGFPGPGGTIDQVPLHGGAKYTDVLPSLNLIFKLDHDQLIRVGAARTMARPRMDQMRASIQFNYDAAKVHEPLLANSPWSGNGGNPELKPWIADGLDVSYEKYFGRKAYVSAALFYKKLKTYVYDRSELFDFTGFPVTTVDEPTLRQGYVTTPQNGEGGRIQGLELTASLPFSMVTPWLDGFGFFGSTSFTESSIQPDPSNPATPIPGLSRTVANLTFYYEKHGFEARVSDRIRSSFIGEVSGFGNNRTLRYVKGESVLDAQLGYRFHSGPLNGLSLLAQVNNLSDEPFVTYQNGDQRQVIDWQRYGRTYMLGLNYTF